MDTYFTSLNHNLDILFLLCDPVFLVCCFAGLGLTLSFLTMGSSKICPFSVKSSKHKDCIASKTRRVLIITAHPDDECMFFGPTILHFTQRENAFVYLLCLSSGDYYKKGRQRSKELWRSCEMLGIPSENVILYRCDDLPDNPSIMWPTMHTSRIVCHYIHSLGINMIITFDSGGVSGHINHYAIYNALEHLIEEEELPPNCEAYCLDTVNFLRKYSSLLDVFLSYRFSSCAFTVSCHQMSIIQAAMKAHASQYLWFRRLYILFSRYVFINTLTRVR